MATDDLSVLLPATRNYVTCPQLPLSIDIIRKFDPFIYFLTIREVRKVVRETISNLLNIQPQRVRNPSATDQ